MNWPLPLLAHLCSPFLTSPTTWYPWWRWSVSRVSSARRGLASSGSPSRWGWPEPAERPSYLCPRKSCSQARGVSRASSTDPSSTHGETEAGKDGVLGTRLVLVLQGLPGLVSGRHCSLRSRGTADAWPGVARSPGGATASLQSV